MRERLLYLLALLAVLSGVALWLGLVALLLFNGFGVN